MGSTTLKVNVLVLASLKLYVSGSDTRAGGTFQVMRVWKVVRAPVEVIVWGMVHVIVRGSDWVR